MNKTLELIYINYEEKLAKENPLETPETEKALGSFFNVYFGHFSYNEYDKAYNSLLNMISAYQENAFEVGFYTAVKLLASGIKLN